MWPWRRQGPWPRLSAARAARTSLGSGTYRTGLVGTLLYQMHTYSDPSRDPRRQTATVAFAVAADGDPVAGDDAGKARFWPLDALPPLAFDHGTIVADYASGRLVPAAATALPARAS